MENTYENLLPHINYEEGKARVMGKAQTYARMIKLFDGKHMLKQLLAAVSADNYKDINSAAHALRGTAGNLSFPIVYELAGKIQQNAKNEQDCTLLSQELEVAMEGLYNAMETLLADF